MLREERGVARVRARASSLDADGIEALGRLCVELRLVLGRGEPMAGDPGTDQFVREDGAVGLVAGERNVGGAVAAYLRLEVEGPLIGGLRVGGVVEPAIIRLLGLVPDAGVASVVGGTVNGRRAQALLLLGRRFVGLVKVSRCQVMPGGPLGRDVLFEDGGEDGVAPWSRRRDDQRLKARRRLLVEECLVVGRTNAVHRHKVLAAALNPDRGVAWITRVTVDAERDHPVAETGKAVEVLLVLGPGDAMVGLERLGSPRRPRAGPQTPRQLVTHQETGRGRRELKKPTTRDSVSHESTLHSCLRAPSAR